MIKLTQLERRLILNYCSDDNITNISKKLKISRGSASTYLKIIRAKFNVPNNTRLILTLINNGIFTFDDLYTPNINNINPDTIPDDNSSQRLNNILNDSDETKKEAFFSKTALELNKIQKRKSLPPDPRLSHPPGWIPPQPNKTETIISKPKTDNPISEDNPEINLRKTYPDCYFTIMRQRLSIPVLNSKQLNELSDKELLSIPLFGETKLKQFREFFPLSR
jgi:DNA-binding CsgD family transcriptional regulator